MRRWRVLAFEVGGDGMGRGNATAAILAALTSGTVDGENKRGLLHGLRVPRVGDALAHAFRGFSEWLRLVYMRG